MQQSNQDYIYISKLIQKRISQRISVEENAILEAWAEESEENKIILQKCLDTAFQNSYFQKLDLFDTATAWQDVKPTLYKNSATTKVKIWKSYITYVAASIILIIGFVSFYTLSKINREDNRIASSNPDYLPADQTSSITLSDGRVFELDKNQKELLFHGNALSYANGEQLATLDSNVLVTIKTKQGGNYSLSLSDGTQVKLNASTTIRYPLHFAKEKRVIELDGEAYFEVSPDSKRPFFVKSPKQEIQVLGTIFNVNAYRDEDLVKTTLVEGKVKIQADFNQPRDYTVLHPGQQSVVKNQTIQRQTVNIDNEISWIKDKFNFDGKSLFEVMRELSRWYDIDVEYIGNIPNIEFFGGTYRNAKISTILTLLENNDLTYELTSDRKLKIRKKQ